MTAVGPGWLRPLRGHCHISCPSGPVITEWPVWTTVRAFYVIISFTELQLHRPTLTSMLSKGHYTRNFQSTCIMYSTTHPDSGRTGPLQQSLGVQGTSQGSCLLFNPISILSTFWFHSALLFHKDRLCHTPPVPSYSISSLEVYRANIPPLHWTQEFPLHQWVEWINSPTYCPPFNPLPLHMSPHYPSVWLWTWPVWFFEH